MLRADVVWWVLGAFLFQLVVLAVGASRRRRVAVAPDDLHFNSADWRSLPPVACPLLIKVDGQVLRASRLNHIERLDGVMDYVTDTGCVLVGRFDWTYP